MSTVRRWGLRWALCLGAACEVPPPSDDDDSTVAPDPFIAEVEPNDVDAQDLGELPLPTDVRGRSMSCGEAGGWGEAEFDRFRFSLVSNAVTELAIEGPGDFDLELSDAGGEQVAVRAEAGVGERPVRFSVVQGVALDLAVRCWAGEAPEWRLTFRPAP